MIRAFRFALPLLAIGMLAGEVSAVEKDGPPSLAEGGGVSAQDHWEWCGWGGGGFFWSAVFHPTRAGTIYLGGDVAGVYKTTDHGRHWRMVNNGLTGYGVYSLAVDRKNPETVYAATTEGLHKSIDGGEHWQFIAKSGPKDLRLTAERDVSVRAVAVDPSDGNVVFAGSPGGKVFKSVDGALTWKPVYQVPTAAPAEAAVPPDVLRVQFGGVNAAFHGGFWLPLVLPAGVEAKDCQGFGFSFKGNGAVPKTAVLTLRTSGGAIYKSRDLGALFANTDWQDVWLTGHDFTIDGTEAAKQKENTWPKKPEFHKAARVDFCCVNMDNEKPSVALFGGFYTASSGTADKAARVVARDFAADKSCHAYGNATTAGPQPPKTGTVFAVAVSAKNPRMVLAATERAGIVLSEDAGENWRALETPRYATSVVAAETDANILIGTFGKEGVWKSVDGGRKWTKSSDGIPDRLRLVEVAISPVDAQDVYVIGHGDWDGHLFASHDGGQTWKEIRQFTCDTAEGCPTAADGLSRTTNLAISPVAPNELFISANWRNWLSEDGGRTWVERDRGADISCFFDVRFQGPRVYATAMDEGTFVSENNGTNWRHLWPLKYDVKLSGHNWRILTGDHQGQDRLVVTASPWDANAPNYVIVSEDGGANFKVTRAGLPDYRPTANTMWGMSYPRALAADPSNPKVIYLGMDGDATEGKCGGGIFKSEDGGLTWKQLARQPGSRRAFFGLAVDPTDPRRLYWAACGEGGGLWRSEDGGDTWKCVFSTHTWIFNVLVASDGTVYCPAKDLWRSTDHGATWKPLTRFAEDWQIVGLEAHPRDPKTMWISRVTWGEAALGGVYRTRDGGETWQEITGDLPYRKPIRLRFNPATQELWAVGVGAFRIKQE